MPKLAELSKYHCQLDSRLSQDDDLIVDYYDGEDYKNLMESDERFQDDARNLFVGLALDGFLPFKDDARYSMWPLAMTTYNLPPDIRCVLIFDSIFDSMSNNNRSVMTKYLAMYWC